MIQSLLTKICKRYLCKVHNLNKCSNELFTRIVTRDYDKVFCIGFGKTGTTSLEKLLIDMGFSIGSQDAGEMLINDYHEKKYENIINYFYSAEAFQDIPSSLPEIYKLAYKEFPNSKFIHTERSSSEEWYNSLIRFHSLIYTNNKDIPTERDLLSSNYRYRGWSLKTKEVIFNYPKVPLYDKKHYISIYDNHNFNIKKFFKNKHNYLNINLSNNNSLELICNFLGYKRNINYNMPHLNKTF